MIETRKRQGTGELNSSKDKNSAQAPAPDFTYCIIFAAAFTAAQHRSDVRSVIHQCFHRPLLRAVKNQLGRNADGNLGGVSA